MLTKSFCLAVLVAVAFTGCIRDPRVVLDASSKPRLPRAGSEVLNALEFGVRVGDDPANESANNAALSGFFAALAGSPPMEGRLPCGTVRYSASQTFGAVNGYYPRLTGCGGGIWDPGASSPTSNSVLKYTGTGVALTVPARGAVLSGFQLVGTPTAAGGLQIATVANIAGLDFRGMTVAGFTKEGAAGMFVNVGRFITTSNFYAMAFTNNYDGLVLRGGSTTVRCWGCSFAYNTHYGVKIESSTNVLLVQPVFQSNASHGLHAEVTTSGTIGRLELFEPYFEANGPVDQPYDIFLKAAGASAAARQESARIYGPFLTNAGRIYVENTTDVVVENPSYGSSYTGADASPFKEVGVNLGLQHRPRQTAQAVVGALVASIHALVGSANVTGLWVHDTRTGTTMTDYSGAGHPARLAATPEAMQAWVNSNPFAMILDSAHYWTVPDSPDFTFDESADRQFSIIALLKPMALTETDVVAKNDVSIPAREWALGFDGSGWPYFASYDNSTGGRIGRRLTAPTVQLNSWQTLIATKSSGTTNAAFAIYSNSSAGAYASLDAGVYSRMRDTAAPVATYSISNGRPIRQFNGQLSVVAVVNAALSPRQVTALHALLLGYAGNL